MDGDKNDGKVVGKDSGRLSLKNVSGGMVLKQGRKKVKSKSALPMKSKNKKKDGKQSKKNDGSGGNVGKKKIKTIAKNGTKVKSKVSK
eukprot:UN00288